LFGAGEDRLSLRLGAGDHGLVVPALHDRQSLHGEAHKRLVPLQDPAEGFGVAHDGAIARVADDASDLGGIPHAVPLRTLRALPRGELLRALRGSGVDLRGCRFERERA